MTRVMLCLLLAASLPVLAAGGAGGDDPVVADMGNVALPGVPRGTPPPTHQIDEVARTIGLGLRCPVCQGLSVADSTSSTAVLIQRRIRELVAAGYAREDIENYFVSKYGEWVLLNPKSDGLNGIVWFGPLLAFGVGLAASLSFVRRGAENTVIPSSPPPPARSDDPYTAALLAEVDDE